MPRALRSAPLLLTFLPDPVYSPRAMFSNSKRESATTDGFAPSVRIPQHSPFVAGQSATVIARGVRVEGEFHSQGDVVIEGDVQGTIFAAGTLTIGSEARIVANITAQEAVISGTIKGDITVEKQAVFHATANITGDLKAERVTVEAGAVINGKVQIGTAKPQAGSAHAVSSESEEKSEAEEESKSEEVSASSQA